MLAHGDLKVPTFSWGSWVFAVSSLTIKPAAPWMAVFPGDDVRHSAGDFWTTSVLGGKHITNICSKHVLCLVPRCLAKLGKLLGILSPSCWGHLLCIPKESGPGHVTGSRQPSGPLWGSDSREGHGLLQ